jgi:sarcosine oxidase subunit alpha
VYGPHAVEKAEIVRLNHKWNIIKGSNKMIPCDTVCLAVGLTPSTRLLGQIGVKMITVPEAGGYIALHDETMQTSVRNVFVAGDASGIEEASTAMIEGKIAGLHAANNIGYKTKDADMYSDLFDKEINRLRAGPFGEKSRIAKEKIRKIWDKT